MQGTATHLLDSVLPRVPMRQWVLSLPRWARFLLARDPQLITRTLDLALRTIFTMQRRRGRRAHAKAPRTGAVTSVQRFGGALNLNVHFHCLVPDGVFVEEKQRIRFVALPCPSEDEVRDVLGRIARRVRKLLRPRTEATECDTRDPGALAGKASLIFAGTARVRRWCRGDCRSSLTAPRLPLEAPARRWHRGAGGRAVRTPAQGGRVGAPASRSPRPLPMC